LEAKAMAETTTGRVSKALDPFLLAPMSRLQIAAVALSIALNAIDGLDVLAMSFAAPSISSEWRIAPTLLGVTISSGLAGMAVGSLLIAPAGDRYGRRPLVLLSLALMALGMLLTAGAQSVVWLCTWRLVTGLGIGGMIAALSAVSAEFANERRRDLCVALMTIGYPVGGLLGGFAAAQLVQFFGWRAIFVFGGTLTAAFLPLVWFFLPESLLHLRRQRSPAALRKMNALLARMGHLPLSAPSAEAPAGVIPPGGLRELLGPGYRRVTLLLVSAYFLHILTFYFYSGWLPKLMSDLGFSTPEAIRTSAIMSMGGVLGGIVLGWLTPLLGLKRLVVAAMIGTALAMAIFGNVHSLPALRAMALVVGIFMFGGIVGLYASLARAFPARMRVTGTGLAIGLGRGGAVAGPIIGGVLLEMGLRMGSVLSVVGVCALAAATALALAPNVRETS
jgi:benzoate transport